MDLSWNVGKSFGGSSVTAGFRNKSCISLIMYSSMQLYAKKCASCDSTREWKVGVCLRRRFDTFAQGKVRQLCIKVHLQYPIWFPLTTAGKSRSKHCIDWMNLQTAHSPTVHFVSWPLLIQYSAETLCYDTKCLFCDMLPFLRILAAAIFLFTADR